MLQVLNIRIRILPQIQVRTILYRHVVQIQGNYDANPFVVAVFNHIAGFQPVDPLPAVAVQTVDEISGKGDNHNADNQKGGEGFVHLDLGL